MTEAVTQARCEAADARAEAQRARGDAEAASRGANATSIDSAAEATDTKLDDGALLKELADAARRASDAEARATIAERELADLRAEVEADRAHASNGPPSRSLPEHVEPAKIDGARTPIHLSPKTGTGEMADETERAALAAEASLARAEVEAVTAGLGVSPGSEAAAARAAATQAASAARHVADTAAALAASPLAGAGEARQVRQVLAQVRAEVARIRVLEGRRRSTTKRG